MKQSLDFSGLTSTVTNADITAFRRQYQQKGPMPAWLFRLLLVFFVAAAIATLIAFAARLGADSGAFGGMIGVCLWMVALTGFGLLLYAGYLRHYRTLVKLARFAAANNLGLLFDQRDPQYSGMIFDKGHDRKLKEAIVFPGFGEIGNYSYTVGSGKNQRTYDYGYVSISLDRRLPHMVLDAKKNNFLGMSNLPESFGASQKMSLEGDFNEHFTLYAPAGYEKDALYIFTPDVMAKLIDDGGGYDMEVVDDTLYLYSQVRFDLLSPQKLELLYSIMQGIGTEVRDQAEYYRDDRVANPVANVIGASGTRLKPGVPWFTVIIFAIIMSYFTWRYVGALGVLG